VTVSFPRGRSSKVVLYALTVGTIGGGASAAAQATDAELWVFAVISLLAFPLVGVSVAIHSFLAVIIGIVWGNVASVVVSGTVLFLYFAAVAAAQALLWTGWTARRRGAPTTSRSSEGHFDPERAESH
jgi:hypothetical protein